MTVTESDCTCSPNSIYLTRLFVFVRPVCWFNYATPLVRFASHALQQATAVLKRVPHRSHSLTL